MSNGSDLDENIIRLLQQDGRMSNREIGRVLGVAESTVRNRLKRLFDSKALRLRAVLSPQAAGIGVVAYVHLQVAPGSVRKVVNALEAMDSVAYLCITAGRFDVLALLTAPDHIALLQVVQNEVESLPGIRMVEVRQVSHLVKHRYDEVRIK